MERSEHRLEGVHCTFVIERRVPGVVVLVIRGVDTGELGDAPIRAIEQDLDQQGPVALFIDARDTWAASIDVSGAWAAWLASRRDRFRSICMLPGSRYIKVTADFVRRFAELGELMQVCTDPEAFDAALARALASR